jgi:hypothetical protein
MEAKSISVQDTKAGSDRTAPEIVAVIFRFATVRIELPSVLLSFAKIDDVLGLDPFVVTKEMKSPVTFGDFVKLYEHYGK